MFQALLQVQGRQMQKTNNKQKKLSKAVVCWLNKSAMEKEQSV